MDKVAFITGSTSGIGLSTAKKLLEQNIKVIVSSEKELDLSEVKELVGNVNVDYIKCDISIKSDIDKVVKYIKEKYGHLDYLVCNAGIMPRPCGIEDITEEVMDRTINTNLKGTFWTLRLIGKFVNETSKDGSIVCLTSVDGLIGEPYGVIYSTTKAGIISLMMSFSRYFKNPVTRVNAVAPGLIDTPLTASTGEDPANTTDLSVIQRMGNPDEIADTICYLLSDKASYITGQVLAVDGGFTLK